ncbi:MAG: GNAT family N-acetyltransferase [Ferruginibacter sp.]
MSEILYRKVINQDISSLAKIRSRYSETEEHWTNRISGYLNLTINPQQSKRIRIIYIASINNLIIGFIAGHLTDRYECDGELQWIDVVQEDRNLGIASELVKLLAKWFIDQDCVKICADPANEIAQQFYKKNGAEFLNDHWMFWKDIRTIFS